MDLLLDFTDKPDGSRRIWLRGRGRGEFANKTWLIESKGIADFRLIGTGSQTKVEELAKDQSILDALRKASGPITAEQLAIFLGQNVGSLRNHLTHLVKQGSAAIAGKTGSKGNTALYQATEASF